MTRPPDSASSVATSFAVTTGLRYGSTYTLTPSRTRVVAAARYASVMSGS